MRVLVLGAYGFIGSQVANRLLAGGVEVVGAGRRVAEARRRFPDIAWVEIDLARATRPEDWLPHLAGIDAVVNCAGVLQDSPRDSTHAVHLAGPEALFAACERAKIRRVIQISAIGVGAALDTAFAKSKQAGDEALMRRDLDWVVLRPSLVVGRNAYGGTALIRALAAFPFCIPLAAANTKLQPVQVEEVAETVAFFLPPGARARCVLEVAGPERMTLAETTLAYRQWLGLKPARVIPVPAWLAAIAGRLGDLVSLFGWRPPLRTTSLRQLSRDVVGDPSEWRKLTGIAPRSLRAALISDPAAVQERWFARLYLLKPLAISGLALALLAPAIFRLWATSNTDFAFLTQGGVLTTLLIVDAVIAGGLGLGILFRATARYALFGTLGLLSLRILIEVAPHLTIALFLPALLEAFVSVLPMLLVVLFLLAILDDR